MLFRSELVRPRRQTICMELIGQRRWAVWMMTRLRRPRAQTARGLDVAEGGAMCSCRSAAAAGQPDSPLSRVRRRLPQNSHEASWWQCTAQLHGHAKFTQHHGDNLDAVGACQTFTSWAVDFHGMAGVTQAW